MREKEGKAVIQSVVRAVAVLRCFENHEELGLTEISKLVGLHKSTTFGLVSTLEQEHLLIQNQSTGRYRLGIDLLRLSAGIKIDLREQSLPFLNRLVESTGETVNLVARDRDEVVYIDKKESPHSVRICTYIGQRMPMYCTAVGKAMLAFLPPDETKEILDRTVFQPRTENTLGRAALENQLPIIRQSGYALDLEELEYGLICVAVPLLNHNRHPIGGLSISGPAMRMTPTQRLMIRDLLIHTADEIAKAIGCSR